MRVDLCAADDYDTIARLLAAIANLGGRSEGEDGGIGVGLHRFWLPEGEISIFVDAWIVDVAGEETTVTRVLEALSQRE